MAASKDRPLWQALVAGSAGGISCTLVGHPFDTVKVRIQTGQTKALFRRLYVGLLSPIAGATPIWAFGYFSWKIALQALPQDMDPLLSSAVAGAFAGFVKSTIKTPVESVKVLAQNERISTKQAFRLRWYGAPAVSGSGATTAGAAAAAAGKAVAGAAPTGFRGLYKGWVATTVHLVPSQFFFWSTYVFCRENLPIENLPLRCFIAGGLAGTVEWGTSVPLDVVKTMAQTTDQPSYMSAVRAVYQQHGIRGYYRGIVPIMLRAFPANGAGWLGLELANMVLRKVAGEEAY